MEVSDGATSHTNVWSELRVSGEKDTLKNKFNHP